MVAFTIEAEPNAVGFYRAMGAELCGMAASTVVPGRELPVLRYRLAEEPGRT